MKIRDLVINQYQLFGGGPHDAADVVLERVRQIDGSSLWAVRDRGCCLNREGDWEWEPMPSSRDEDFIQRCRFDTAEDALEIWKHAEIKTRFWMHHKVELNLLEGRLEMLRRGVIHDFRDPL